MIAQTPPDDEDCDVGLAPAAKHSGKHRPAASACD